MENWATLDDMIGTDRVLVLDDQREGLEMLSTLLGVDYIPEDGERLDYSHAHRNAYPLKAQA